MSIVSNLLDVLLPRRCHICESPLAPHESFACTHCLDRLPRSGYHRRPLNPMEQRFAGIFPFDKATGFFLYSRESPLSQLVQDMKYRHFPAIGDMLGNLAASELFSTGFFSGIDMLVPVPMHFLKQARRGYNQTVRIASGVSSATGIPVAEALKACRPHTTQTSLTLEQRLANTADIFSVALPESVEGKGVLLIDDICTTGATITSAAETIWTAQPSSLSILTIGVTF